MVAAGNGTRFGADKPKQYFIINNQTILEHSIARLNHHALEVLTLVVSAQDVYIDELMIHSKQGFAHKVALAVGGDERWQSAMNGLQAICRQGASDDDWVLIHDAARPCLPYTDLDCLINKIQNENIDAAILASPVVDTLKYAKNGRIVHTVPREHLWQALTPQAFKIGTLKAVFDFIITNQLTITDEASACEVMGVVVEIVSASRMNLKLTYAEDLPLIAQILMNINDGKH